MNRFENISNTQLKQIIDEWIKSQRDRDIMKRRLIDGLTIERLAEEFDLSARHTYDIVRKNLNIIIKNT